LRKGEAMKKILYLFDNINYQSGAQKVTFFQMKSLCGCYQIHAFSLSRPLKNLELQGIPIIGNEIWEESELFACALKNVITAKEIPFKRKIRRIISSVFTRLGKGDGFLQKLVEKEMREKFETYDVVIVVSEASQLRELVARLKRPKKIQWIHTDYALWSEFSEWTKMVTKKDAMVYSRFDWIVTLSEHGRQGFVKKLPELKEKTVVIPNLVDRERILKKAEEKLPFEWKPSGIQLITVGRLEKEKGYDRILDLGRRLKEEGFLFCWYLVGDGPMRGHLERRIAAEKLGEQMKLIGRMENPYPLMKRCDYLVLLSEYEGTPVTIDEAMVLGVPVIARKVGGIGEQMKRYGQGIGLEGKNWYESLKNEIGKSEKVGLVEYKKLNEQVICQLRRLLEETKCGSG